MVGASAVSSIAFVILKLVFITIGVIFFAIFLLVTKSRKKQLREYTIATEAVIVDMTLREPETFPSRTQTGVTPLWFPTYQYTINGTVFTVQSIVGTESKEHEVGDRIRILVDPKDHNRYALADIPRFRLAAGVLFAMAAFFFAAAIIISILA